MGKHHNAGKPPRPRLNLIVVLIFGITIKAMFILLAWYVIPDFVGPLRPLSHAYFEITLMTGGFLTGLAVGFLVRDQLNGALGGLLSAVLATISLSVIISATLHPPLEPSMIVYVFSNLFFIIAHFPPDLLALIGGAIGASIAMRIRKNKKKREGVSLGGC